MQNSGADLKHLIASKVWGLPLGAAVAALLRPWCRHPGVVLSAPEQAWDCCQLHTAGLCNAMDCFNVFVRGACVQSKEIERLNKVYTTILKNAGVEYIGAALFF